MPRTVINGYKLSNDSSYITRRIKMERDWNYIVFIMVFKVFNYSIYIIVLHRKTL
jgi:hypothetical protein